MQSRLLTQFLRTQVNEKISLGKYLEGPLGLWPAGKFVLVDISNYIACFYD